MLASLAQASDFPAELQGLDRKEMLQLTTLLKQFPRVELLVFLICEMNRELMLTLDSGFTGQLVTLATEYGR